MTKKFPDVRLCGMTSHPDGGSEYTDSPEPEFWCVYTYPDAEVDEDFVTYEEARAFAESIAEDPDNIDEY